MSIRERARFGARRWYGTFAAGLLLASPILLTRCSSESTGSIGADGSAAEAPTDAGVADVLVVGDGHACASPSAPAACAYDPSFYAWDGAASTESSQASVLAARAVLVCPRAEGGYADCLSDGSVDCYGKRLVDGRSAACANQCCPGEYGISGRSAPVPPGCRVLPIVVPGSIFKACCPCR